MKIQIDTMFIRIPKNFSELKEHLNDPLFKNSYFLMGNTIFYAVTGFFFWFIAARLFSVSDVGLGSAIVSAMGLLSIFSLLGFDISLIRYLPQEEDKKGLINSSFTIVFLNTLLLSLIFLLGLSIWSPALIILKSSLTFSLLFIFFTIFTSLSTLQVSVFLAFRVAKYSFFQSIANIVRLLILPFLIVFNAFGIFSAYGFAFILTFFVGNNLISKVYPSYRLIPTIKKRIISDMFQYSFGNYVTIILGSAPILLLPILVLNILGPVINAYFFIAWTIASILSNIPYAISRSLLAEGSISKNNFDVNIRKSLKFSLLLLVLSILVIFILGKYILLIFGQSYVVNSFDTLIILSVATIPYSIIQIYAGIKRVEKDINPIIIIYASILISTIISSYLLAQIAGLVGVSFSWLASNGVAAIFIAPKLFGKKV